MISKKKAIVFSLIIILFTISTTLLVSSVVQIPLGSKVVLSKTKYNELKKVYDKQAKVTELKSYIDDNYIEDVDDSKLEEGQLKGMFEAIGDPYSVYMDKEEFKTFMEQTKGTFGGIGVVVSIGEDNRLTVVKTIRNGPSDSAGIKKGDKIVKVDGKEFNPSDYSHILLMREEIIKSLRGEPGTSVSVTVLRSEGEGETLIEKKIKREVIQNETIDSKKLGDIGYISISSFDDTTAEDFKAQLKNLEAQDIKGLVLDLRFNPGGILDSSVKVADELMGKGTVVYTEDKYQKRNYLKSDSRKIDIPLVVLVNGESASAAEVVSGALQDTKEATIVGTKTFGKGIVQTIRPLSDGSGLKLTVSKYFTPSGRSIHKVGVKPDIVVELPETVEEIGPEHVDEDTQLKKAIDVLNGDIAKEQD